MYSNSTKGLKLLSIPYKRQGHSSISSVSGKQVFHSHQGQQCEKTQKNLHPAPIKEATCTTCKTFQATGIIKSTVNISSGFMSVRRVTWWKTAPSSGSRASCLNDGGDSLSHQQHLIPERIT